MALVDYIRIYGIWSYFSEGQHSQCIDLMAFSALSCQLECRPSFSLLFQANHIMISWSISFNAGSCVAAGYSGCCTEEDCVGFLTNLISSCFCDEECYKFNDCCDDITEINCTQDNGKYMYVRIVFLDYVHTFPFVQLPVCQSSLCHTSLWAWQMEWIPSQYQVMMMRFLLQSWYQQDSPLETLCTLQYM